MSFYNIMMGQNNISDVILKLSNVDKGIIGRFRDVWVDGERKVTCVYTRLGGGNRECYCGSTEEHEKGGCYQSIIEGMQALPNFVTDYDDDFDCTYATFEYSWPKENEEALAVIAEAQGKPVSGDERWEMVLNALKQK